MSEPIIEKIAKNVKDTINAMDGFTTQRRKKSDFSDATLEEGFVLITQSRSVPVPESAFGVKRWNTPFILEGFVDSDGETELESKINTQAATLMMELEKDANRNGLAIDTEIGEHEPHHLDDFSGYELTITIDYRTKAGDPFTGA